MKRILLLIPIIWILFGCSEDEIGQVKLETPTDFKVTKGEFKDRIQLSWSNVNGAFNYNIYKFDSISGDYLIFTNSEDSLFNDTTKYSPELKIYYKVRAYNSDIENSDFSNAVYGYLKNPVDTLGEPSIEKISKGEFYDKIVINWSAVVNANSYQIYRLDTLSGTYTFLNSSNELSFIDTIHYTPYEKIYYRVNAYNSATEFSNLSSPDYGYLKEHEIIKLDRPIDLKVSKGEFGKKITLSWTEPPKVNNYRIFKFFDTIDDFMLLGESQVGTFIDESEITPYVQQYYKIQSYNSEYEYSDYSDVDYGYTSGVDYDLVRAFGSRGHGNGQFDFPEHLNIDQNHNVYVSDPNENKIQKFNENGTFLEVYYNDYAPRAISFLNDGNIAIARSGNNKIAIFDQNRNLIREWGQQGTADGMFNYFKQITNNDSDHIYVTDALNHRIQKFDVNGNFLLKWGSFSEIPGNGKFNQPWGITEFRGMVFVSSRKVIQIFTTEGVYIDEITGLPQCYDITHDGLNLYLACGGYIAKTDETFQVIEKIGEGTLSFVTSMALDENGIIYAMDYGDRQVKILKKN
jgi:hypothetical protein